MSGYELSLNRLAKQKSLPIFHVSARHANRCASQPETSFSETLGHRTRSGNTSEQAN